MNNKTVLQISNIGGSYGGNFVASLNALGDMLAHSGWRQKMVFPERARQRPWMNELLKQGKIIYFLKNASRLQTAKAIKEIADLEKAQILHTHFSAFDIPAWIALKLRKMTGKNCQVICHQHSLRPDGLSASQRLKYRIRFGLLARSTHTIVLSEAAWSFLLKMGTRPARTHLIPNGIDLERVTKATRSREAVRQEFALDRDDLVLLQFGWDPEIKGIDITLEAAQYLIKAGMKFKLLAIDGLGSLKKFINNRYGDSSPSWLKIAPPTDDIANYYQAADIFVSASRSEGFPYAVAEAMVSGLPIIASDILGVQWLRQAPGVEFFPSEDAEGLARAIRRVRQWTPEQHHVRTLANCTLVKETYSVEIWAKKIFELYKAVLSGDFLEAS